VSRHNPAVERMGRRLLGFSGLRFGRRSLLRWTEMPTIAALLSMFVAVGAVVILAGATTSAILAGVLVAVGGVCMGLKLWTDSAVPKSVTGWIGAAATCLGAGATVYAVECVVGRLFHPDRAFIEAGLSTGPFGGLCTVVVTSWLVLFTIGGAAHRGTEKRMQRKSKEPR